jgi:hypothetical protein
MKVWILLFAALPLCAQTESESWNLFYQATLIGQYHGTFRSPYSGSNSLQDYAERDVSLTSTLLGFRLGPNTTFYFDPEIAGGGRFSNEKLMELSLLEFLLRLSAASSWAPRWDWSASGGNGWRACARLRWWQRARRHS